MPNITETYYLSSLTQGGHLVSDNTIINDNLSVGVEISRKKWKSMNIYEGDTSKKVQLSGKGKKSYSTCTNSPSQIPTKEIEDKDKDNKDKDKKGFLAKLFEPRKVKKSKSDDKSFNNIISSSNQKFNTVPVPTTHSYSHIETIKLQEERDRLGVTHGPLRRVKSAGSSCANETCKGEGNTQQLQHVKHCTSCFKIAYCSEYCKISHWPKHKRECKCMDDPLI